MSDPVGPAQPDRQNPVHPVEADISQHLAKLRLAGWVDSRRDGRRLLYRVTDPHIVTLVHQAVEHILELRPT